MNINDISTETLLAALQARAEDQARDLEIRLMNLADKKADLEVREQELQDREQDLHDNEPREMEDQWLVQHLEGLMGCES